MHLGSASGALLARVSPLAGLGGRGLLGLPTSRRSLEDGVDECWGTYFQPWPRSNASLPCAAWDLPLGGSKVMLSRCSGDTTPSKDEREPCASSRASPGRASSSSSKNDSFDIL